jgi:predicted nucleic acid-binding protein
MRASVLADAGPLYAAVDPEDAHHHRALRELDKLANEKREVLVTFPTLLEAYSLVRTRLGPKIASGWLGEMTDAALLNPAPEDYRQAFAEVQRLADQRISLFDATVAALARRLGVEVWTYDHDFDVMRVPVWR